MTDFEPYCLGYISWKNDDGSFTPRQVKKLPKNVSKEVLQSFFREFVFDDLEKEYEKDMEGYFFNANHFIEIGERMIERFRAHEIYQLKTEKQRKNIEDFLRFHPETIEVARHYYDSENFIMTNNFEVVGIKKNAEAGIVIDFLKCIAKNLGGKLRDDAVSQREFVLETIKETEYFKALTQEYKDEIINYIKYELQVCEGKLLISVVDQRYDIEDFIAQQTINKYKEDKKV